MILACRSCASHNEEMVEKRGGRRPKSVNRTPRQTDGSSWASTPAVRARMQRQRTRDTAPELAVRRLLHASGLRYRVDSPPLANLSRRADVVFGPAKVALFIDGCFWHGCPVHGERSPTANAGYWREKIERNKARDLDTDERLHLAGWLSLRVWEHEDPQEVAAMVVAEVRRRRGLDVVR
ncbi:very short patch repair endonuclease [Rhodococcus opacus]|uniref:very short patch repair endonuclease n=1 Tax=Rhodococcus opacus TaxID=37919 RepID=UPI0027D32341|nr:very short patch repair endonuclease [Rhodococcus opacus]